MKTANKQKTLLSGVKPTGRPHIGNYFGAMRQLVEMQGDYKTYAMVVDYHALNFIQNADEMRSLTRDLIIDYLAIGLDPKQAVIFKQSDVPSHTELAWIFNTIITVPYLSRAHAYKDAQAKGKEVNVGTFTYPVLMAADILLYDTDAVPVGQDQKQHIEYARDIAEKFNGTFGKTFKLPEALIMEEVAVVPGTDGRKMSKSYGNTIGLFASDTEIEKAVMSIVTDSGSEVPKNVHAIHSLIKNPDDLDKLYSEKKGRYKELKEALIEDLKSFIRPLREKRAQIEANDGIIKEILREGAATANEVSGAKLSEVKKNIGVD